MSVCLSVCLCVCVCVLQGRVGSDGSEMYVTENEASSSRVSGKDPMALQQELRDLGRHTLAHSQTWTDTWTHRWTDGRMCVCVRVCVCVCREVPEGRHPAADSSSSKVPQVRICTLVRRRQIHSNHFTRVRVCVQR